MQRLLERALPVMAAWGPAIFIVLIVLAFAGVWWLGRGRMFLVPRRWPARAASAMLLMAAGIWGACLYGVLGPMRPMLEQVRSITGTVGRPADDLAFRGVGDDRPQHLSDLRGRVVLLNLWATWCPPCRYELPAIDRLQREYSSRGLVVVTISNEERRQLLAFADEHPLSTTNVYTSQLGWLDVGGRPLTLIIDRDGTVRQCMIGARSYEEFERAVAPFL